MTKKWKIILICLLMLPCVVFFGGCSCEKNTGSSKYDNVTHNVSFYTGSGDTFNIPMQTVAHGGLVIRPPRPTRENYSFIGWYKDINCTIAWKFESDQVTDKLILYAGWSLIVNEDNFYTVIFDTDTTETEYDNQTVKAGGLVSRPATDPVKDGYNFVGWYRDEARTIKWKFESDVVDKNTIIYAKWNKVSN